MFLHRCEISEKLKKYCRITENVTNLLQAVERQLILKSKSGFTYLAELRGTRVDHKMDHLACFTGALIHLINIFYTRLHNLHNSIELSRLNAMKAFEKVNRDLCDSKCRSNTVDD